MFKPCEVCSGYVTKVKEELATTKLKIEKVTEVNTDYHNSWSKMGVELLKLKAELAQVKEKRDRYQEALEWYVNNVDTGKVARQALENK